MAFEGLRAGGGGGGTRNMEAIGAAMTLYDPGDRVDRPGTQFNASNGTVTFRWNGANSNTIVGGMTVAAPRFYGLLSTLLPSFDPTKHVLWVRLSSIDITNNTRRMGLGVWVSDHSDESGTGGGGVAVVDYSGTGSDDRPGETSSAATSIGTAPAEAITDIRAQFDFLENGDVEVGCQYSTDGGSTWGRNRGTRRDLSFSGGTRPAAGAIYLQIASLKAQSGLLNDDDLAQAVVSLGYTVRPT